MTKINNSAVYFVISQLWILTALFFDDFFTKALCWFMATIFIIGMWFIGKMEMRLDSLKRKLEMQKFELVYMELTQIKKMLEHNL